MRRLILALLAVLMLHCSLLVLGCKGKQPDAEVATPTGAGPGRPGEPVADTGPSLPEGAKLAQVTPTASLVLLPDQDVTADDLFELGVPVYAGAQTWRPDFALSEEYGLPMVVMQPGLDDQAYAELLTSVGGLHVVQTTPDSLDDVAAWLDEKGDWQVHKIGEPQTADDAMGEFDALSSMLGGQAGASEADTLGALGIEEGLAIRPAGGLASAASGVRAVVVRTVDDAETLIIGVDNQGMESVLNEYAAASSQKAMELLEELMAQEDAESEASVAEALQEPVEGEPVTLVETPEGLALKLLPAAPIPTEVLEPYSLNGVFQYQSYRIDGAGLRDAMSKAMAESAEGEDQGELAGLGEMMASMVEAFVGPMVDALTKHAYILAVESPLERVQGKLREELADWRVGNTTTQDGMRQFAAVSKVEIIDGAMNVFEGPDDGRSYIVVMDQRRMMRDMFSGLGGLFGEDLFDMEGVPEGEGVDASTFDQEWESL